MASFVLPIPVEPMMEMRVFKIWLLVDCCSLMV
jgi:hypothetical protein